MTKKEFNAVKTGDKVLHKHIGECLIQEIMYSGGNYFGTILRPLTDESKLVLHYYSGAPIDTPTLVNSIAQLRPLDRPFKEENKLLIHFRELLKKQRQAVEIPVTLN